jgi:hypothetical protein
VSFFIFEVVLSFYVILLQMCLCIYIYISMSSPIKDQGLGPKDMVQNVSQEQGHQSNGEGYQTPRVSCPSIDRTTCPELQHDRNYDPQEDELKYKSFISCVPN